jgi:Fe2+ or Zn2+ uptake regulation protein
MTTLTSELDEARISKSHRLVYEIVLEQGPGHHLPMSAVYQLARERRPTIGFTTVYRALTRLREIGLVEEVTLPGAEGAFYEISAPPHAHFRCVTCGHVSDVKFSLPAEVVARSSAQIGAEITAATVSLEGRCADCIAASP